MAASPLTPNRNAPCPCGSGKRFKHCHGLVPVSSLTDRISGGERSDATPSAGGASHERAEHLFASGNEALQRNDHRAAVELFSAALREVPDHPGLLNNLGLALERSGDLVGAEAAFRHATLVRPEGFDWRANLAQNLFQQRRYQDALLEFDSLIASFPIGHAAIFANRAVCQVRCGDPTGALDSFRRAIELAPTIASLHADRGALLWTQGRLEEARTELTRCLELDGRQVAAARILAGVQMYLADWENYAQRRDLLLSSAAVAIQSEGHASAPFNVQAICDDPALELRLARAWTSDLAARLLPPGFVGERKESPIRLGFVSRDLFDHPVGRLVVGLFAAIDRRAFSVAAYGIGHAHDDVIRARIERAVDSFCGIDHFDAQSIARKIREDEIDVLFDLNGFTGRVADVFALRPAPIQINYLGYTGTLGLECYDYMIADRYCIGEEDRACYVETPLYVDPCYLPSDDRRQIDPTSISRRAYGLPDSALVLCAPSAAYKITPEMYELWMRLLEAEPSAVLWLRAHDPEVMTRLRAEAGRRLIRPDRLVFGPREESARFVARSAMADLVLDTYPFGSHTSVNDAMFVGCPVVTQAGRSFASRASASQVRAAGISQLVAGNPAQYFEIARRLMRDRPRLQAVRQALTAESSALFDTARYTRAFEEALQTMWSAFRTRGRNARAEVVSRD